MVNNVTSNYTAETFLKILCISLLNKIGYIQQKHFSPPKGKGRGETTHLILNHM